MVDAVVTPAPGVAAFRKSRGRGLTTWLLTRVIHAFTVAFSVVIMTFLLVRLVPGDAVSAILGGRGTPETREALRRELGLDVPLPQQLWDYLSGLAHGDFGNSLTQQGRPVASIIAAALPVTLMVILGAVVLAVVIGIPVGLFASTKPGVPDLGVRLTLTALLTSPPFFIGLLLLVIVARTGWLPVGGWDPSWTEVHRYLILPWLALAAYLLPLVARTVRQQALDVQKEQWHEGLVSRGVPVRRRLFMHVLPNSALPVTSLIGYNVGVLITNAVVIEAVFGIPGLGQQLQNAVQLRDYPLVQGIAVASALLVVAANLLADVVSNLVDPRTRS